MYEINTTEWGPARHNPDHPANPQMLQLVRDQRDIEQQRPDDN